ncbi:MAG: radical SAM protein [Pseudomonadota bacterium]
MSQLKTFKVVLIKPSHYDDDGYVIQWLKSIIPSNTLAALYGVIGDCAARKVLGDDVRIEIDAYDETNTVIPIKKIIRSLGASDGGFVGLVGVQSNQFPRAVDLARQFRAHDLTVIIGGFHVAGCLAMLPEMPPEIGEVQEMGVSLYAGETEGRMDEVLLDVWNGIVKPLYRYMSDLPDMDGTPVPYLPDDLIAKAAGNYTSFDSGRGCPFQCSFCTIINVQGRKSRYRSPDDIEQIIRINEAQGIRRYFITDDNFARNKNWEAILDRMIYLREEEKFRFKFIIQVDTLCHRTPGFVEKAARAGCNRVFIGLENIDPDALMSAKKRQNKIWEYRDMMQAWKHAGVITYAGYILGFPDDTPEKIKRNIEIIQRELPLDLIEFFYLTPLPGSEDHQTLHRDGVWMDPDLNKYDLNHRVSHHPVMTDEEWDRIYLDAWKLYYTPKHFATVIRRQASLGLKTKSLFHGMGGFYASIMYANVHPLEAGFWRRRVRKQRRHGMALENPLIFYPKRTWMEFWSHAKFLALYLRLKWIHDRVVSDPSVRDYSDLAMTPTAANERDDLDLIRVFEDQIPDTYGAPVKRKKKDSAAEATAVPAE